MRALLFHLDGSLPNIALMRISAHLKSSGWDVEFRRPGSADDIDPGFWGSPVDAVYASAVFAKSEPMVRRVLANHPEAIIGGTGSSSPFTLEELGIGTSQDYSLYPDFKQSIGFTQRGCRRKCPFCVVPEKEGSNRSHLTIKEIWRGNPWPRQLILLDNDFFGQSQWLPRANAIINGGFSVSFSQGINARSLTKNQAEYLARMDLRNNRMTNKLVSTAWDNTKDEKQVVRGIRRMIDAGISPGSIQVYMLIGYGQDSIDEWDHRRSVLRSLGVLPYPMMWKVTPETSGFRRWVLSHHDKRTTWRDWQIARYQPRNIKPNQETLF